MKKVIYSVLLLLIIVAVPALAHAPDLIITHIQGQEVIPGQNTNIFVPHLPFTVPIEGTVSHGDPGNLSPIVLSATDNGEPFYGPEHTYTGMGKETEGIFDIPWSIESVGVHVITVTAAHGNKSDDDGFGGNPGNNNTRGCKAAPALASRFLKDGGLRAKHLWGNLISKVGKETGKSGELWAKESCGDDYYTDTITFVVELL